MQYEIKCTSNLNATQSELWKWITSLEGITKEMSPFMRMTTPAGITDLQSISFEAGKPLFHSWLLLFKVVPFDYSDFTLQKVEPEESFLEESSMGSMHFWRHVRHIEPSENGCFLIDELTFKPRFAGWLSNRIVKLFFEHRHRQLRRYFGIA